MMKCKQCNFSGGGSDMGKHYMEEPTHRPGYQANVTRVKAYKTGKKKSSVSRRKSPTVARMSNPNFAEKLLNGSAETELATAIESFETELSSLRARSDLIEDKLQRAKRIHEMLTQQ
jgi:hypothetical protein